MLITILPAHPPGTDHARAEWAGQVYSAASRNGIVSALARVLIAAGCPDQPWQAARDDKVAMTGPSLAAAAALTVSDPEAGAGPRFARFVPFCPAAAERVAA